ncbi:hypothetical protein CC78DRAFT_474920, partial [Lojkania enalia]
YKTYENKQLMIMEDNRSVHTSKAAVAAEHELGIQKIWWLANSPDLNAIENVWRLLEYRVQKRFPHTDAELCQYLIEE